MKYTQTISIEQKYGKYLFDKKIKTKKVLSKQVSITKEDINLAKNNIESQFRDVKGDKKKLIQIIQSFEDPLSPDKVTLENLSFISDIKASDTKFTIQLKEELPKIKHESIKPDFFCNAIVSTKNIDPELNLLDFKKNYFIEPLLNNLNINTQKDIKTVNNENNHNNINENENENKIKDDYIENKDNKNDCNNNNNEENQNKDDNNNEDIESNNDEENKSNIDSNIDEDNNNKDEKKEEENEDEELAIKKKNLIIKSLIYFNRDGIIDGIENFKKRIPDYNKSKYEEDNKFEKNVYIRIEDRIREYLNKYKCDKLSQLRDFENSYLLKIINFQKKSVNYKNISIKGIIIGLLNIINDFVGKEYLKISEDSIKNDNYEKGEYFLDLYEKYEIMKKFCFYLQKDFILLIDNFKEDINFEFTFDTLFSDIYWDYVFRIKELNIYFTNNYNNDKISKKTNKIMDNIIDILINIDLPYKKMFGDILNMSCIKKENIYLMNYIIKYRRPLFKNDKENININNNSNNENDNEIDNDKKLHISSSCDKILNNKINNIEEEDNNKNSKEEENNKNKINNDDNNSINIISEDISTNDCNNINNSISNDNDDKKLDLNLGKSLSMEVCNNKLSDKDSLEKVYNYILYGENENEKKKQKKRHKKRKKNKINNSLNMEEKEEEEQIDPVVEEYKNYINNINQNCTEYVKKIKPNIKEEWINYISTSIDE